ncbi:hypothetical protein BKI52_27460 [marine bacterium AO1-C]|nr:hypothetical protein BKI52_27460 [marine bacterium AO1-C]
MTYFKITPYLVWIVLIYSSTKTFAQITIDAPETHSLLYLGKGDQQPLIVGLGGSEGGNAWASDYWRATREQFIKQGYAFLALGYFGSKGIPQKLDRIAIENVYKAIQNAAKHPKVNANKIAIIGGSRGGDLALLLGSYYSDISCIVAIVPSHVVFPGHTNHFTSSSWTYQSKELPFVPVSEESIPFLIKKDLRGAFVTMLKNTTAEKEALIKVEKIKGPILLISATQDEIAPTTIMCEKMALRLKAKKFQFYFKHIAIKGKHNAPLKNFNHIFDFLQKQFPVK